MKSRTWILATAICALIAGVICTVLNWDRNPRRPEQPASLSVAATSTPPGEGPPSGPAAKQNNDPVFVLHVGDPYSKAVALYGEVQHQKNGYRSWTLKDLTLTVVVDEDSIIRHLWVSSQPGYVLCSPEGFCLGGDDFETFTNKARSSGLGFEEQITAGEGMTVLDESLNRPLSGKSEEKVQYTWSIDDGDVIDGKPFEGVAEEQLSNKIFLHVPVKIYSLDSTDPKYKDRPPAPGTENEDGGD
jgi:hypothetical protein